MLQLTYKYAVLVVVLVPECQVLVLVFRILDTRLLKPESRPPHVMQTQYEIRLADSKR